MHTLTQISQESVRVQLSHCTCYLDLFYCFGVQSRASATMFSSYDFIQPNHGHYATAATSSLATHMSVLAPTGLLGAGVPATDLRSKAQPVVQMSDAVGTAVGCLKASKSAVQELEIPSISPHCSYYDDPRDYFISN
eukprot:scaffold2828_cov37-Prasinocladus_malaysianus.AAC.2